MKINHCDMLNFDFHFEITTGICLGWVFVFSLQKNVKIILSVACRISAREKCVRENWKLLCCSIVTNHLLFHLGKRFLAAALRNVDLLSS